MGAADNIKKGLTEGLKTFTKQRKAEERSSSAGRWRSSRMTEVRGQYMTEIAEKLMTECYMKASDNGSLPATARQIYYVARPLFEEQTEGKPLRYEYFSQTLLPKYIDEHAQARDWDVVWDDRGHFVEPHTGRVLGLGTLNVRHYLSRVADLELEEADFDPASVRTYGPDGSYGALLYIEKEGFMPLFRRVKLGKRYDLSIMSSKGMSVVAARQLADGLCAEAGIPLLVLHDFDQSGIIIRDTLANDTRRFSYTSPPDVIDLGLNFDDITGLAAEPGNSNISDERLIDAGLDNDAIEFLRTQRVELNAMTSRQLIDFVERKLQDAGIGKVIPDSETLKDAYKMFVKSDKLWDKFEKVKEELDSEDSEIEMPKGLAAKVKKMLEDKPDITWARAIQLIVNPKAPEEKNAADENDGEHEDDDLSDIGE
jgi:hypothetical protein